MKAKEKGVSRPLAVLLVVFLCTVSYMLGARHSSEKRSDTIRVKGAGAEVGANADSPSVPNSPSPENAGGSPAADDGVSAVDKQDEIAAEERERMMRNIADTFAMPEMNAMILQQQRVLMADKYRSFIESLGLSSQEEAYLMDLLTARRMLQVDMGMKLMTGLLSEAERAELMAGVHAGMEEVDKEIDWFLNSDPDSEFFRYYENTEGERAAVASMGSAANQAGYPLEEGAEEALVSILHDEMNNYPFSVSFEEDGEPVFSNFTAANIDTFIGELEQLRDPVLQEASAILDPEQLELFENYYVQFVAFHEQRLRMAQQFFNPGL